MTDWGASEANRLWLCEVALPGKPKAFGELHVPYIYQVWHVRPVHHLIWRECNRQDLTELNTCGRVMCHCEHIASVASMAMLPRKRSQCYWHWAFAHNSGSRHKDLWQHCSWFFFFWCCDVFAKTCRNCTCKFSTHWIQDANLDTFTFPQTSVSVRAVDELSGQAKKH